MQTSSPIKSSLSSGSMNKSSSQNLESPPHLTHLAMEQEDSQKMQEIEAVRRVSQVLLNQLES